MKWNGSLWNRNIDLPQWLEETDFDLSEYGREKPRNLMKYYNVNTSKRNHATPMVDHSKQIKTPVRLG